MEWIEGLQGEIIGLDTAPLIYFIEENPAYLPVIDPFFAALDRGEFRVVTSTVTLLEVLIHPLRQDNLNLAQRYRDILVNADGVTTFSMTSEIAELAAQLRAEHNIRTPDAIQVATTLYAGATYFLTNDTSLPDLPGLTKLILDDLRK